VDSFGLKEQMGCESTTNAVSSSWATLSTIADAQPPRNKTNG
jgi:hypothetical protein